MLKIIENYINNKPDWFKDGIFIIFIGIVISLIIYLFTHRITSKYISLDKFKKIKPEIKIPIFKDFLNDTLKVFQIEFITILQCQMEYLEEQSDKILERLIQLHRHLLKSKYNVSNVDNNLQLKAMRIVFIQLMLHIKRYMKREFKTEFRTRFLKDENINNSYDFIEREFESYYITMLNNIRNKSRAFMRENWIEINCKKFFTREESWKITEPDLSYNGELGMIIKDISVNAVKMLLHYNKDIKELEKKIDENMIKAACYE